MGRIGRARLQRCLLVGLSGVFVSVAPTHAGELRSAPATQSRFVQVTRASWYGREFEGQRTAGGNKFHPEDLTAAHRTLDIGSKVKVTELRSGRSVVVEINDRGPFAPGRGIDLSLGAARQLGMVGRGVAWVRVERVIDDAPVAAPAAVAASVWPISSWWPTSSWLPKAIAE